MPDRYAAAVRARRRELRALRPPLAGGHRAELRSCLALSRLAATAHASTALAALRREVAERVERGDRAERRQLPGQVAAALDAVARELHGRWVAGLRPALRRIATERGLEMAIGWPRMPAPAIPHAAPPPEPVGPARSLLAGAADGAAMWRLALLPLAALPLLGLPAVAGPRFAPLAVGAGVGAAALVARERHTSAERLRLRRHCEQAVATAATAIDADLDRRLLELERAAGAALDAAVLRRRACVDAELAVLAAGGASDG